MRRITVLLLTCLALAGVPAAPATAEPLDVDAGFSLVAYNGQPASVQGRAFGGAAPYALAWSASGSPARFADPAAASTVFDTAGLAAGTVALTLTVTDALGATASDDVLVLVGPAPILVDQTVTLPFGVPEERASPGGGAPDRKAVNFFVPAGTARIEGTLSWPQDGVTDLDLDLNGPLGATSGAEGRTSANPERATVSSPPQGFWQAQVKPLVAAGTTARLVVQAFPAGALPVAVLQTTRPYGELDAQVVRAAAQRGTAPYSFAWDLDDDGRFETPGETATLARAAGMHVVPFKATDAAGFEVLGHARLDVRDVERALRIACHPGPDTLAAMEFAGSGGTCWVHGGHHTYALAGQRATLRGFVGGAFAVEQQFSPSAPVATDPTAWPMHVETSEDGLEWTEVGRGRYVVTAQRQAISFALDDLDAPFRFFRIHAPLSAAQGLSGYLDHSEGYLLVDGLAADAAPERAAGERALTCERDLMEDFFAAHPCWFGGIDRYDAPSFWHTYALGENVTLDRVLGSFQLAPWRSDDWANNNTRNASNVTNTYAALLTSVDGSTWTEHARIAAAYGAPTPFDVDLGGTAARFVQLFPEPHHDFDNTGTEAPNHHPRGFFVDSRIVLTGQV